MTSILAQNMRRPALLAALAFAAVAGGCGSSGPGLFSTGSITEPAAMTKTSADPACTTLATQIDGLRKEGTVDRLEKAADGKTSNVTVQRASLTKQVQLNKANADFIAKCGPTLPKSTVAAVAAPAFAAPVAPALAAPAVASPAAAAAKAVAATAKSGVTSAADTGVTITPQAAAAAAKAAAPVQ
jgi:hypothetical protein